VDKKILTIVLVIAVVVMLARPAFATKPGASISTKPEMIQARNVIADVWRSFGYTLTVTSGTDSTHSATSLHYSGLAEDYRISGIPTTQLQTMIVLVRTRLGSNFDVILEADHLHVEYDPG